MPRFDGTGPSGRGSLTGRGMGFCVVRLPDAKEWLSGDQALGYTGQQTGDLEELTKEVGAMPRGDGTGPGGMGPMTGHAAGYCAGYPVPGCMNPIAGRGFWGWGRGGGGWGRRNRFYANGLTGWQRGAYSSAFGGGMPYGAPYAAPFAPTVTAEQELGQLKGQAEYFEDALDGIKKRIEELEAESKDQ